MTFLWVVIGFLAGAWVSYRVVMNALRKLVREGKLQQGKNWDWDEVHNWYE